MRDLFFQELARISNEIRETEASESEEMRAQGTQVLVDTISAVWDLCELGRCEGLIALEEEAGRRTGKNEKRFLVPMIYLITDGTDPQILEEICLAKYSALGLHGRDALQYLMFLFGCLGIQAAENPRIIETKLLAMVPEHVERAYHDYWEEPERKKAREEEDYRRTVGKHCVGEMKIHPEEKGYLIVKLMDEVLPQMDDKSIQTLLQEVTNADLEVMMMGLSGEANAAVFRNVTQRMALVIATDMDFMAFVRTEEIVKAASQIYIQLVKLIENNMIVCGYELAKKLAEFSDH